MIGIDFVSIKRIQRIIECPVRKTLFIQKLFSLGEAIPHERIKDASFYAGRWAAKEASFKAAQPSCGLFSWMKLSKVISATKIQSHLGHLVSISISHDDDYAVAIAFLPPDQS